MNGDNDQGNGARPKSPQRTQSQAQGTGVRMYCISVRNIVQFRYFESVKGHLEGPGVRRT